MLLTELQLDALTELLNLGVSQAALSLREMLQEEVLLSVPRLAIITRQEAVANFAQVQHLIAIYQDFDGVIRGRALLIFPEARSVELVRAIVGSELSVEEMMEVEHEALAETGNILLNACLTTFANSLGHTLRISLPEVLQGDSTNLFHSDGPQEGDGVLLVSISFAAKHRAVKGHIAMVLDFLSLLALKGLLDAFIGRTTRTDPSSPPDLI